MSTVRRSVIFSALSGYSVQLIGLFTSMAVARMLTPSEIGTFSIASALVMVISEFRVLGAGAYLVREKEMTPAKVRSALGLTILISWTLGALVFLSAPYVADFYKLPAEATIFRILSISFLFAPLISIPFALFSRALRFDTLFKVQLFGAISNMVTTIILIKAGMSFYALAWGYTASIVFQFVMFWLVYSPELMSYRPAFTRMGDILSLGIFNSISNVLRRGMQIAPDMVIGKIGTTFEVGMYSRGLGFISFLSRSLQMGVQPIALPYLSDTRRAGGNLSDAFARASTLLGGLVVPVFAVVILSSLPAIRVFFGPQWDAAAPIASWLAIRAVIVSSFYFVNDLLVATHNEKVMLVKDFVTVVLVFAAILLAYPYGLVGIAQSLVVVAVIETLIIAGIMQYFARISVLQFAKGWFRSLLVALGCFMATLVIRQFVDFNQKTAWFPILVLAVFMPVVWFCLIFLVKHPIRHEMAQLYGAVRTKLG